MKQTNTGFFARVVNYWNNRKLFKATYTLKIIDLPKALENFVIVHLTELNFPNADIDYSFLIRQIAAQKPDMIVITGNIVNKVGSVDFDELKYFAQGLANIAPTYAVSGYHEYKMSNILLLKDTLAHAGIHYLENETYWHAVDNSGLLVMGLDESSNNGPMDSLYVRRISVPDDHLFDVKILLSYHPEWFLYNDYSKKDALPDIVFAGRARDTTRVLTPLFDNPELNTQKIDGNIFSHPILQGKLLVVNNGVDNNVRLPFYTSGKPELIVVTLTNDLS